MNTPRILPERVYFKHGAYYYVAPKERKWIKLGKTEEEMLAAYSRITNAVEVITTMNQLFDKYLVEVVPNKAPRSQADNRESLKWLRQVFGHMKPTEVKPRHVVQYLTERKAKVRANREIALLSHVFTKALNWGIVEHHPCLKIERNPEFPRERYVADKELTLFKRYAPEWLRAYIDLKLMLGLRQADMLKLTWESVTPEGLYVTISKSGRGAQRRGMKRKLYTYTDELYETLLFIGLLPNQGSHLFMTERRVFDCETGERRYKPHGARSLDAAWDRVWARIREAGERLEHFREHDLRAKFGTDVDDAGEDATELLDHEDRKTTKIYLRSKKIKRVAPAKRRA